MAQRAKFFYHDNDALLDEPLPQEVDIKKDYKGIAPSLIEEMEKKAYKLIN